MTKDEAFAIAAECLGYEGENLQNLIVEYASDGWSGPGFYAWDAEYPEEGSLFVPPNNKDELN